MTAASNLTRRLVLETPERAADGAGGFTQTWVALGVLWGEIVPGTGREATGEASATALSPARITLRAAPQGAPSRPRPGQRLREGARLWRILSVDEVDRQGRFLVVQALEEIVP